MLCHAGLILTSTSGYESPGGDTCATMRNGIVVVFTDDDSAEFDTPYMVEPVLVDCAAAKQVLAPMIVCAPVPFN